MPRRIVDGFFARIPHSHFHPNMYAPHFPAIYVNFISFGQPEVWGVRLLEIKLVIFARSERLLESVR